MKSVRTYQREIAKLKDLVAGMQWVQPTSNSAPSCAGCGAMRHQGCEPDCPAAAVTKDHGRPENPQAYADYCARCQRNAAMYA